MNEYIAKIELEKKKWGRERKRGREMRRIEEVSQERKKWRKKERKRERMKENHTTIFFTIRKINES